MARGATIVFLLSPAPNSRLVLISAITGRATAFWMKWEDHSGAESGDDTGSDGADICEDTAESHRTGDGNALPVGQPAASGARIQSNRGARAKVRLITKSNRKGDRHDARTLALLARIDPELLGPVRHRSAQAQSTLTVIRARAQLVRARTALVNAARGKQTSGPA